MIFHKTDTHVIRAEFTLNCSHFEIKRFFDFCAQNGLVIIVLRRVPQLVSIKKLSQVLLINGQRNVNILYTERKEAIIGYIASYIFYIFRSVNDISTRIFSSIINKRVDL